MKGPRSALGIPDTGQYGDLTNLSPGQLVRFVSQLHDAERAGRHFDMRFGTPESGLLSWATRHPIPQPGQKRLWFQQPVHSYGYGDFEGKIEKGYGKGKVRKVDDGQLLITKINPDSIHFTLAHKKHPERFVMMRQKNKPKDWLIVNVTPTKPLPHGKVHYTSVPAEKAEEVLSNLQSGSSVQTKIDGASSLIQLFKDRVEVLSYRRQKETGRPIVHTERMLHGIPKTDIPKQHVGSVLRGEMYGVRDDRAVPVQELGGLLNSSVAKSITDQKSRDVQLRNMLYDVEQAGKKPMGQSVPYEQRIALLKAIQKYLPGSPGQWHLPEEAHTPEAAKALLNKIKSQVHPLSVEGVVVHPPTGMPKKMKLFDEYDVHIRNIFPGEGKYRDTSAGGFDYSHEPDGPIVGKVGTGLSDETRSLMWANPNDYIGRVARVRAQQRLPSGALRVPALIGMHEDYPLAKTSLYQKAAQVFGQAIGDAPGHIPGGEQEVDISMVQDYLTPDEMGIEEEEMPAAAAPQPLPVVPPVQDRQPRPIKVLLKAKAESDRRNYVEKHKLLRELILRQPEDFIISEDSGGPFLGITHVPTGFAVHLPRRVVPDVLPKPVSLSR